MMTLKRVMPTSVAEIAMTEQRQDGREEIGDRLLRTSSCLRQEGVDQTRRTFLIVGREEVETPPQLIPQRHTVEDDPSHDLGPLSDVLLWRPRFILRVRDDPEAEIAFAVIDLIDDFDDASIGAIHDIRPGW